MSIGPIDRVRGSDCHLIGRRFHVGVGPVCCDGGNLDTSWVLQPRDDVINGWQRV